MLEGHVEEIALDRSKPAVVSLVDRLAGQSERSRVAGKRLAASPVEVAGELVEEKKEGGMQVTRWVTEKEVAFPSLIFGRFQVKEGVYESKVTGKKIVRTFNRNRTRTRPSNN